MDYTTKEVKVYVDGTPMVFNYEGVPTNWTDLSSSGDLLWGGNPDRASRFFAGMMDEIRLADVVRSQEWIQTSINNLETAMNTLRTESKKLSNNLSIITAREEFSAQMINTLNDGAAKLTEADMNEEGANMLMLQTRQALGTTSLSLAGQAAQGVLRLF